MFNMHTFSSSTRNQHPNHGLVPGTEKRRRRKKAPATSTSSSTDQVSPPLSPHPPHHIFGLSGPPDLPPFGPWTSTESTVLHDSLPCNQTSFDKDTLSDTSNTTYTSFESSCQSEGSARAVSGAQAGPVFGPDRWSNKRGQASRGNMDLLALDPEFSDDGMEVSDEATNALL